MKAIKIILLFCIAALSISNVQAQKPCEIDSYTNNNETGFKIIQSSIDKSFYTVSVSGLYGSASSAGIQFIHLNKYSPCGNLIWKKKVDSTNIPATFGAWIIDLWEDSGNILFTAYFNDNSHNNIRLFKSDTTGNLYWKIHTGDSTQFRDYTINNTARVEENKFVFAGYVTDSRIPYPNNKTSIIIMTDTNGNRWYQDTLFGFENILNAYKFSNDSLLLLGYKNKTLLNSRLNYTNNRKQLNTIKIEQNFFPNYLGLNYENNEIFYIGSTSDTAYFARYSLNGTLIKEKVITVSENSLVKNLFHSYYYMDKSTIHVKGIEQNKFIISGNYNVILDSNFNIIWYDTLNNPNGKIFLGSIKTKDSTIASVGTGNFHTSGIGNIVSQNWFGITSLFHYVKSITISGNNLISALHGTCQLNALISPLDADNPNIIWSVNDSNIASVSQTSLVTAKTNGIVTVVARSQDGSGIMGSKNVVISNQDSKTNEVDENKRIQIFPNPANEFIILTHNTCFNELHYTLFDMYGKEILKGIHSKSFPKIDINGLHSGFYFLKIEEFAANNYKIIKN